MGLKIPTKIDMPMNQNIGADENPKNHQPKNANAVTYKSDKLSMTAHNTGDIKTRVIGILCDIHVNEIRMTEFKNKLEKQSAIYKIIATKGRKIKSDKCTESKVDENFITVTSACFEAIIVPDEISDQLKAHVTSKFLLNETFKPVSYTHLYGYKRQHEMCAVLQ